MCNIQIAMCFLLFRTTLCERRRNVKQQPCRQAQAHADVLAGKQPAAEPAVKTDNAEAGTGERSGQTGKTIISEGAPKRSGGETMKL